ncbi:MAG: T9SS type A sorting domain-containing protein [Cyclobacteriaceae bacterium]
MRACIFVLLLLAQPVTAQFTYSLEYTIPVSGIDDQLFPMPWAGGLNATQFNTIDLNGDGNDDLAIFDRTANRVITFLNTSNHYQYAPEFASFFPADISGWMLLRDYNGDGKKDIFTSNNQDIRVYTNTTTSGENLSWEVYLFTSSSGSKSDILLSLGLTTKINVHLNADDLPAVSDADGDGDLDLFVPRYPSGAYIEFHKNFSVERYGTMDSLDFERSPQESEPWGGVTECDCGVFAFNNDPCNTGGRIDHAGGKSLLAYDWDNDGDQDMLLSESECNQLYLLKNDGSDAVPLITAASPFPPGFGAAMVSFPTAFYEDVDFDGAKDVLVTPNIFARESLGTNFRQSVWFYKNTGSTSQPVLSAPIFNFLQRNMIDVGDNATPAFFDADGDGDLDLFVGCYSYTFSGSVFYFENTGSPTVPVFKLISNNFFGISSLNLTNIKPFFADMNGDALIDFVFTASNQFGTNTQLYYFANQNGIGLNIDYTLNATGFLINTTENISVADVNRDGKNDLLVGKQNGSLQYWQNIGTAASPAYTLDDDSFLGLGSSVLRSSPACVTADLDADGKTDLVLGDQTARGEMAGRIMVIPDYRNATDIANGTMDILYNPLSDSYTSLNLGGKVWPAVGNIFKSDKPSIIIGNTLGGLHVLKHAEANTLPEKPSIDVYPNPVAQAASVLNIKTDRPAAVIILNSLGQEMDEPVFLQAFQEYSFQTARFSKGIYLLYFVIGGKTYVHKIAIH